MKRVIITGTHHENGDEFSWLLPESLTDEFNKQMKWAIHNECC